MSLLSRCLTLSAVASLTLFVACSQPPPAAGSPAAEAEAIRALSMAWTQAMNAKDMEKTLSYYAPDATVYPPNAPAALTADQRRQIWTQRLAPPGYRLDITASSVEVARSGDVAVESGAFLESADNKQGKPTATRGKYLTIWKRQQDGSWKAFQDIWNPDQ